MVKIIIVGFILFFLLFLYCSLVIAKESDSYIYKEEESLKKYKNKKL